MPKFSTVFQNRWLLLAILALTWGTSFILIKKSVEVFTPYQVGALRVTLAGLVLLPLGIKALPKAGKRTLFWAAVTGALGNFFPMFLFPMAEVKVSSAIAGVLNSLVPIFVLLFSFMLYGIRSSNKQIGGAVLGFVGANVLMYFSGGSTATENYMYGLLIILATAMYALSGIFIKKHLTHIPSLQLSGIVFTLWLGPAVLILLLSGFSTDFHGSPEQWTALGYVSILGLVGTATAMILFYKLIQMTSAVFASSVTYLMPVVAVFWGVLAGEEFSFWFLLGGILILGGVYLIREK
ncbi:MAG: EamA family transporter [Weeksellaceae bacterium]|nr:EamA family transporter [Weeksellaceae bacterium]